MNWVDFAAERCGSGWYFVGLSVDVTEEGNVRALAGLLGLFDLLDGCAAPRPVPEPVTILRPGERVLPHGWVLQTESAPAGHPPVHIGIDLGSIREPSFSRAEFESMLNEHVGRMLGQPKAPVFDEEALRRATSSGLHPLAALNEAGPSAVEQVQGIGASAPQPTVGYDDPTGDDVCADAPGAVEYLRGGR